MLTNDQGSVLHGLNDRRPRPMIGDPRDRTRSRTIVVRQGNTWQSLAVLCLCLALLAVVMLGHEALRRLDARNQDATVAMASVERKVQQLESGMAFDSTRRQLLLGMRNRILQTNPRVSLSDAYAYARLALEACEKYPALDPLLLLSIGIVESGYDPHAKSHADARGLYQIWPSTGRLLVRTLGWNYDDSTLYDPEKNTEAAALYLDILFSTYRDPQMVLAEYNGGPLNAGFFRAGTSQLAAETRNYVPRVLELYGRLKEDFAKGVVEPQIERLLRDSRREGKTLGASPAVVPGPATVPGPTPPVAGPSPGAAQGRKRTR